MDTYDDEYPYHADSACSQDVCPEDVVPPKPTWLKWLIGIGLLATFITILVGARAEHAPGVCLAFINCIIAGIAIIKLANKRSLCCIIPITFLAWLIIGWCVSTIYFAIFMPDAVYVPARIPYLYASVKLQIVIFLFMAPYLVASFYMLRNEQPYAHVAGPAGRRLNFLVLSFFSIVTLFFASTKVLSLPGVSVASTFLNYSATLPLVLGAQITHMRKKGKLFAIAVFGLMLFFFALANARRYAMIPIFSFLVGFFLLSQVSTKTKLHVLLIVFIIFPAYMVIGNTVRRITGEVGYEDLAYKLQAMKEWKRVAEETPWSASVFSRLFFTGGHSIITRTPSEVPYLGFAPSQYFKEVAVSLIPGKLIEYMPIFLRARYLGNFVLNDYGFRLTPEHQAGVTLLGHFWLLGGYPFIIVGAIVVSLLQWAFISLINWTLRRRPEKALFYFAFILAFVMWMPGREFITSMRQFFWRAILGMAFYYLFIGPLLRMGVHDLDSYSFEPLDKIEAI